MSFCVNVCQVTGDINIRTGLSACSNKVMRLPCGVLQRHSDVSVSHSLNYWWTGWVTLGYMIIALRETCIGRKGWIAPPCDFALLAVVPYVSLVIGESSVLAHAAWTILLFVHYRKPYNPPPNGTNIAFVWLLLIYNTLKSKNFISCWTILI